MRRHRRHPGCSTHIISPVATPLSVSQTPLRQLWSHRCGPLNEAAPAGAALLRWKKLVEIKEEGDGAPSDPTGRTFRSAPFSVNAPPLPPLPILSSPTLAVGHRGTAPGSRPDRSGAGRRAGPPSQPQAQPAIRRSNPTGAGRKPHRGDAPPAQLRFPSPNNYATGKENNTR